MVAVWFSNVAQPPVLSGRSVPSSVPLVPLPIGPAPTSFNARPAQNWRGTLVDFGPGEQQGSANMWHLHRDVEVNDDGRDVLSVIAGPYIGTKLRVMSVEHASDSTRVHHREVNLEVWDG